MRAAQDDRRAGQARLHLARERERGAAVEGEAADADEIRPLGREDLADALGPSR
jgi:hypothetical protein